MEVAEQNQGSPQLRRLSENSEYDEAKTEQGKLYSRIAEIKVLIDNAEIVDNIDHDAPKDTVTLGSIVKVRDIEDDYEETYEIVGLAGGQPPRGTYFRRLAGRPRAQRPPCRRAGHR